MDMKLSRALVCVMTVLAFGAMLLSDPAHAGAKYLKEDHVFASDEKPKIVVVKPSIFVGTLDGSGREIEVPDWLTETHINLQAALLRHQISKQFELQFADWNDTTSEPLSSDLWATIQGVNGDVIFKAPQGTFPMPPDQDWQQILKSVERKYHEYYLPREARDEIIASEGEADYALFIYMHDAYSTSGAMLGRLLAGMGNVVRDGVNMEPGPPHHGFSMLIDLRDGAVVWFYNDGRFGGDLRKRKSADKRVRQMLRKFPLRR